MKQILLGLVIGIVITAPATVLADTVIKTPWTHTIYNVSNDRNHDSVSVFDDQDNKCYIVVSNGQYNGGPNGISCVKK